MVSKERVNLLCISFVAPFLLLVGYFLFTGAYLLALVPLAAVVACMETRVRMGYRSRRGLLFVVHLACAIGFILVLLALISFSHAAHHSPAWLLPVAYALLAGMAISGAILIRRSWHPAGRMAPVV